tara:strand:- start:24236 stop:24451 length:216 start_codon:yes stop_codon:yes gene_type:complete
MNINNNQLTVGDLKLYLSTLSDDDVVYVEIKAKDDASLEEGNDTWNGNASMGCMAHKVVASQGMIEIRATM